MARNLERRIEALERLAELEQDTPRWRRRYYLPHTVYSRVLVESFRNGDLIVADGRIAVDTNPARRGWRCDWIAAVLNAFDGWGDVFVDDTEIAEARALLDLGWIGFGYRFDQVPPRHGPPSWQVLLSHAATHELYRTDPARYFAVHATGRTFEPAIAVAAWRLGQPITTLEQVAAWLATARPLALSMAMIEAIGPIRASALVARSYGYDPDQLERADDDEELE